MSSTEYTKIDVRWIDRGRDPQCPPDPAFPDGKDVDLSGGGPACATELEHPTPRCGLYVVTCLVCGYRAGITTAGRPDDPRSVKLPCQRVTS